MSKLHNEFMNALGDADTYIHTLQMMTETAFKGEGKNYCAFMLVLERLGSEIDAVHSLVSDMEEQP